MILTHDFIRQAVNNDDIASIFFVQLIDYLSLNLSVMLGENQQTINFWHDEKFDITVECPRSVVFGNLFIRLHYNTYESNPAIDNSCSVSISNIADMDQLDEYSFYLEISSHRHKPENFGMWYGHDNNDLRYQLKDLTGKVMLYGDDGWQVNVQAIVGSATHQLVSYLNTIYDQMRVLYHQNVELEKTVKLRVDVQDQPYVFLSYAIEDSWIVDKIQYFLESKGIRVWRDSCQLNGGDFWEEKILNAIHSDKCMFFITFQSLTSINKVGMFQKELKRALAIQDERTDKFIIPIRVSGECTVSYSVQQFQWIDFSLGTNFEQSCNQLYSQVQSIRTIK